MKETLLEIVQSVLSEMTSDNVNHINDTQESEQVSLLVKDVFEDLIANDEIPELETVIPLTALGDLNKPNFMMYPDTVTEVTRVEYNVKELATDADSFVEIKFLQKEEFFTMINSRNSLDTNVTVVYDFKGNSLNILNNKAPEYFTSLDDNYLIFDSYNSVLDTTLQASKSRLFCKEYPTFSMTDTYIPPIDANLFPRLKNAVKARAFAILKTTPNAYAERAARQQEIRLQNRKHKLAEENEPNWPDYGRRRRG